MSGTSTTSNPSFSTNLRISATPLVDAAKYPDVYADLSFVHFAIRSLQGYIDQYLTPIVTAKATEIISVGAVVSFVKYADGSIGVRNAANNVAGKEADAFALQSAAVGNAIDCQTFGINELVAGVVVGQRYYLGTAGALIAVAPVAAGTLAQEIGIGITPSSYLFRPAKIVKQN